MFGKVQALLASGNYADQTQFTDRLMEEGFQATEVCSALFSLLLGQGSVEEPQPQKSAGRSEFPNELPDHEGFAQPKGFKKGNFQQREHGAVQQHSAHASSGGGAKPGFKSGFKPNFKPSFEKGKQGKFSKGFKKDRGPR
jgi:hypothetical protein